METIFRPDEGYYFGIGAFETIGVEEGTPMFLEQHYERLMRAMDFFCISLSLEQVKEKVEQALLEPEMQVGRKVIKIAASAENLLVGTRVNTYQEEDYQKGFLTEFTPVRRNETSPLTFHKTLNYSDNLMEKRKAKARGIDEPIFLNTKGKICEGASTNVFFVKRGRIITPPRTSGILPGIMRSYLLAAYPVREQEISPEEVKECEEMFLTNSLLGIMPVTALGEYQFPSMKKGRELQKYYGEYSRKK